MLLRYIASGERQLGDRPEPSYARLNWEFFAVVGGKIAPFDDGAKNESLRSNHLWLFPPGVAHGWTGEPGQPCEIVVIHFSSVPRSVEQMGVKHGVLQTSLTAPDVEWLSTMLPVLQQHYWNPTVEMGIHVERVLLDLCLIVVRDCEDRLSKQAPDESYSRVVRAEDWLRQHLPEKPTVSAAAKHVGLSVSQLGRLFGRIRQEPPQDYLNRIKIERALELLGSTNAKLDEIAAECGFSGASNLCRAFKQARGISPTDWRREKFLQYRPLPAATESDYRQFGERVRPAI